MMRSGVYFVFIVFFVTAILLITVALRTAENRVFYRLCIVRSRENHLKQQLWQKQLQLESRLNPGVLSRYLQDQYQRQ